MLHPRTLEVDRTSGIAMTEFVVVLPIALILVMAVAELGQALMQYNTLTKALRDGARHAANSALAAPTNTIDLNADLVSRVKNLVVYGSMTATDSATPKLPGLTPSHVTVVNTEDTENIVVSVSYPYSPIFSTLPMFGFGSNITPTFTLQAAIVMRAL